MYSREPVALDVLCGGAIIISNTAEGSGLVLKTTRSLSSLQHHFLSFAGD